MATLNKEKLTILKDSIKADNKGRIALGNSYAGKQYRIHVTQEGDLLLETVAIIPEKELWLYQNSEALTSFRQGLEEATAGKVSEPEDWTKYTTPKRLKNVIGVQ